MKIQTSGLCLIALLVTGCASGYKQFYQPAQGATPERVSAIRIAPPAGAPQVDRAPKGDPKTILDAYVKRGYVMIGSSMFNSGRPEQESAAIEQARDVGADLVLIINPQYTGSVTSSVPITTPTTTTSYSTGSATAYGAGGPVTAYGSGTTTTYGTSTTYVPMTVHRSDYGAIFFVKRKFSLGTMVRDLNDAERLEQQTNKGVVVRLIVDGTPAYTADLLVGDIVKAIDGVQVINTENFESLLKERNGKKVTLSLVRQGRSFEKSIQLNWM